MSPYTLIAMQEVRYNYEWNPQTNVFTAVIGKLRFSAEIDKGFIYYPYLCHDRIYLEQGGTEKVFVLELERYA